jgi:CelD/BcsL family acetyltransferase involved in cellulose biosynthesis
VTRSYTVDVLDVNGLRQLGAAQWDELSRCSIDDNPFYARSYVLAGLDTIDDKTGLRAVAVRDRGTLVGLFPFQRKWWPFEQAIAAANVYQFSSQPLIHRDHAPAVVAAWLDAVQERRIPRRWTFPNICHSSHFLRHCQSLGGAGMLDLIPSGCYGRARLTRLHDGFDTHLRAAVSKSRVKDIQRSIRRLSEAGTLGFERQREPEVIARRIEDFLLIEHSGWKGRAGTSFLANDAHAEFARQAFRREGAACTSVDTLTLDGQPIAISINLQTGDTVFTPKCAYDEAFRKFSPGLVLEYLVLEAFYRDGECIEMDSATTVGDHVIQGLWNCEKPMTTMLIGPQGLKTRLLAFTQQASTAARKQIKASIGSDKLATVRSVLRRWRYKGQLIHSNAMLGTAGLLHTVETLAPVL